VILNRSEKPEQSDQATQADIRRHIIERNAVDTTVKIFVKDGEVLYMGPGYGF
jgi:hypothetical protein